MIYKITSSMYWNYRLKTVENAGFLYNQSYFSYPLRERTIKVWELVLKSPPSFFNSTIKKQPYEEKSSVTCISYFCSLYVEFKQIVFEQVNFVENIFCVVFRISLEYNLF